MKVRIGKCGKDLSKLIGRWKAVSKKKENESSWKEMLFPK